MREERRGVCPLCERDMWLNGQRLVVDHCHETGKVRSLLCSRCNRGMGMFEDNPESLRKAAKYLEDHRG